MLLPDGARVPGTALQPRVEPEIAVILGERATELADTVRATGPTGAPRQATDAPGDYASPGDDAVTRFTQPGGPPIEVRVLPPG